MISSMKTDTLLGKNTSYPSTYDSSLLFPIPRKEKRDETEVPSQLPFTGIDIWNAYEVSWLNEKGKPEVAIAEFTIPCSSPNLIESKSFKLYLNSFNQTRFGSIEEVKRTLEQDLSNAVGQKIDLKLIHPSSLNTRQLRSLPGTCIDHLDVSIDTYTIDPSLLQTTNTTVEEELTSYLLKSNCLVTGQPDWASLYIHYAGPKIDHASLLKYIISFREHLEFHEQCIERIFMDLIRYCYCQKLTVYGRYTRRGGLDINPFRSNFEREMGTPRTPRQ